MFDVLTNNPYKSAILLAKGERANPMEIGIFKYDNGLYLMISIRSFPYRIDNVLHKVSGQPDTNRLDFSFFLKLSLHCHIPSPCFRIIKEEKALLVL